jgi:uncharacterized membrane protein (DUF106 family)
VSGSASTSPPLPSAADDEALPSPEEAEEADEEMAEEVEADEEPAKKPQAPQFRLSTFVYTFLFLLGILMVFDTGTRNQVASLFGRGLAPVIGFGGHYLLATMFFAAAIEMLATAVAYNWTTDWVKAARVQKWSAAFRKVQMKALRSGKKDKVAALQQHQQQLTRLSGEVSMAQLKGMAVTWFLIIAVYSWVGLFILSAHNTPGEGSVVSLGGAAVDLMAHLGPVPAWFLIFTLYTVPMSLIFRRVLKHYSLRRHAERIAAPAAAGS